MADDRKHAGIRHKFLCDVDGLRRVVLVVHFEDLDLGARIVTALVDAGIKTVAGLSRKSAGALKELDGIGDKAVTEIEEALAAHGVALKSD